MGYRLYIEEYASQDHMTLVVKERTYSQIHNTSMIIICAEKDIVPKE